jgi:hypothetical protein
MVRGMARELFLTIVSGIATGIGVFAVILPGRLLSSKGVAPNAALHVWVREVGILLLAIGVTAFLVRGQPNSPTLRAFLVCNAIVQVGLLPIEVIGYVRGVLTKISGVVPNTILHIVLAASFIYYATTMV